MASAKRKSSSRDNLAGIKAGLFLTTILLPGMVIQWFMYMNTNGQKYGRVREATRRARSPIMTWIYSIIFWVCFILFMPPFIHGFVKGSEVESIPDAETGALN